MPDVHATIDSADRGYESLLARRPRA
jgi:hypothetical protein